MDIRLRFFWLGGCDELDDGLAWTGTMAVHGLCPKMPYGCQVCLPDG